MNQPLGTSQPATTASSLTLPIIGVLVAIATTTTMDATGLSSFSALVLLPLMFLFWYLSRLSRAEIGFKLGHGAHYGLAILYPVVVIGAVAMIAAVVGAVDLSKTNWQKAQLNFLIMTATTFVVVMITEEGFFRGWLWGSLRRTGMKETRVLVWSSIAFALWHISSVTLSTEFKPPPSQIPVFLVNAAVMGIVWGLLRAISGSIIVASLSHGLWNGVAYVFFGFGIKVGALGITNTAMFGPEIGIVGLVSNLIFAVVLWRWWNARPRAAI
jgi:membrane protease YdiL (CAAX protease family)